MRKMYDKIIDSTFIDKYESDVYSKKVSLQEKQKYLWQMEFL